MMIASNRAREATVHAQDMDAIDFLAQRKALGLTQVELADALGITSTHVARMERGERKILMHTKLALRALRVLRNV